MKTETVWRLYGDAQYPCAHDADNCLRDTDISRLAPPCTTPTLMALARHGDYRATQRYIRVDGTHLQQAVEALAEPAIGT